ncbi:MAG TPA: succinate dehydrogenase iron-sulfur subunit [Coxiellaceae bacterium]|nr:succinate dehydrogenase iron-sulfur subunit [Coxiellaceae bacterium]
MTARTLKISVSRYNPEKDKTPFLQVYALNTTEFQGNMLLNALEALRERDPTLSFRRSCGEGVCGSDGMNVNGRNGLACITRIDQLPDEITVRPLPGLPIVRDLIVDMTQFYEQLYRVKPYLKNNQEVPARERLQSPEDRAKLDGLYECILCACCSTACPSFWWNPDKFVGPAGLLTAYRFIADSRDTDKIQRLERLKDPFSVFRCRTIMNCATVCPKDLNPAKAIREIKSEMLKESS